MARDDRPLAVPRLVGGKEAPRAIVVDAAPGAKPAASGYLSQRRAAALKLALFVFFVLTRALHPMLIDLSKSEGRILYAKNTPVVMNKILTVLLMNAVALLSGGAAGVRQCWQPRCLAVFGLIGAVYALGDFLEMLSMAKLSGGVYQVLLQTKLLITALMSWWLKGTGQGNLQWHVLLAMFLATSAFVLVDQQGGDGAGAGALPLAAVVCVMLKVAVSCYCAVLSEKYLKAFSELPVFAKISGLSTTWAVASLLLCSTEPQVAAEGFFAHWDYMTWLVTASFVVKTVSTMYLLQALDSLQKNIGEALAVIVIYLAQVAMAGSGAFDLSAFLLAVLVVALVKTYLIAPKAPAAGKTAAPARRAATRMRVVNLNAGGKPQAAGGVSTMVAELHDALPPGVFYGMLGGVYPVCGKPHPSSPNHYELAMLAHPPAAGRDEHPAAAAAGHAAQSVGFMPEQSLTVLGQLRPHAHEEEAGDGRWMQDIEHARASLLDGLLA